MAETALRMNMTVPGENARNRIITALRKIDDDMVVMQRDPQCAGIRSKSKEMIEARGHVLHLREVVMGI